MKIYAKARKNNFFIFFFKNTILKNQILFRKNVLCETVPSKRLFQMGESINNKYNSFNLDELRENLIKIINLSSKSPEERASAIIESSVLDEG